MGRHSTGKHRIVNPYLVRNRIGAATAIIALGLISGGLAAPAANADVALQAYSTPLVSDAPHHDGGHDSDNHRGDRGRDGDRRGIRFHGRGHFDNVCGPRRIFVPRLHRTVVVNNCARLWRDR